MRICFISREYPPDTGWGGIATFAYHLVHGLQELGHEVEVVSLAKNRNGLQIEDGVRVHRVAPYIFPGKLDIVNMCMPYSRHVLMTSTALWNKFLELHQEKPFDVIDAPELLAEGLYPAATKTAPLVIRLYTPHSKFIAERLHNVTPTFDHEFVAILERIAMYSAEVLTSPSDDLAKFVAGDLNIDLKSIRIVRNPIDPKKFSPEGARAIPADSRPTILFVGRLEERKGITYLVEAIPAVLKSFPTAHFVIIGDDTDNGPGQTSVLSHLKRLLAESASEHAVTFINRVPLDSLPDYYRSADICVVPSVYDNSPYTCLEAMSCGQIVLGTTGGGIPEYLVDGESGKLVPPRDTQALATALVELLSNPQERQRLGQNARKRVLDHFQRTEIAGQTCKLYEQAIESFAQQSRSKIYLKPQQQILSDAEELLYAYNNTLGNLLYQHSLRFRIRHWFYLHKRPKLLVAKALMLFGRLWLKLTGQEDLPKELAQLQQEISLRQNALRYRQLVDSHQD